LVKWKKSPPDLIDRFSSAAALFPAAEQKKMFGYPTLFIQGNLTAGLFQDRVMMRLSPPDRERFLKLSGARMFEPMPGRPMKDYVEVPEAVLKDAGELRSWLAKSVSFAATLPAKKKKTKGEKKGRSGK
jgi:TfoX/Sxy family transcriptional regulator of competence genes